MRRSPSSDNRLTTTDRIPTSPVGCIALVCHTQSTAHVGHILHVWDTQCPCETHSLCGTHCPHGTHTAHVKHCPCGTHCPHGTTLPVWDTHCPCKTHCPCGTRCPCETPCLCGTQCPCDTHCLCETHCPCETHACVGHTAHVGHTLPVCNTLPVWDTLPMWDTHYPCETGPQSPEHVLQSCPLHKDAWTQHWPQGTRLCEEALSHTGREDLAETSSFINIIKLVIGGQSCNAKEEGWRELGTLPVVVFSIQKSQRLRLLDTKMKLG